MKIQNVRIEEREAEIEISLICAWGEDQFGKKEEHRRDMRMGALRDQIS